MRLIIDLFRALKHRALAAPDGELTARRIILWWEARRLPYNLIVGITGVGTIAIIIAFVLLYESLGGGAMPFPDPPLFVLIWILLYGLMANACYTGGWIVQLIVIRKWNIRAREFGPIAFSLGLAFSVMLTLAPAAIFCLIGLSEIVILACR